MHNDKTTDIFCVELGCQIICPDCCDKIDPGDINTETVRTVEDVREDPFTYTCDLCGKVLKKNNIKRGTPGELKGPA